jgi:hypothetical protein
MEKLSLLKLQYDPFTKNSKNNYNNIDNENDKTEENPVRYVNR